MKTTIFFKKLDSIKSVVEAKRFNEIREMAEAIFEQQSNDVKGLKRELETAQGLIDALENSRFELPVSHQNIIAAGAIESLFLNLDKIPMLQLESFVKQFEQ